MSTKSEESETTQHDNIHEANERAKQFYLDFGFARVSDVKWSKDESLVQLIPKVPIHDDTERSVVLIYNERLTLKQENRQTKKQYKEEEQKMTTAKIGKKRERSMSLEPNT